MKIKKPLIGAAFLILIIILTTQYGSSLGNNEFVKNTVARHGYLGVFWLSVISGFNLIVPIPVIGFLPFLVSLGLSQWVLVFIISIGLTIADIVSYIIGKIGRKYVGEKAIDKKVNKLRKMYEKHHWVPIVILFLFAAFVPMPNEVLVIPLSFLGFRLRSLFPVLLAGNLFFNTIASVGLIAVL